jgi:hypothetical protein
LANRATVEETIVSSTVGLSEDDELPMWETIEIESVPVERLRFSDHPPRFSLVFLSDSDLRPPRQESLLHDWLIGQRIACVCPLIPDCWWSNRTDPDSPKPFSAETFLLEHLLPTLFDSPIPPLGIFGVGSGGQGAVRLGLRHPNGFPIAAGIDSDLDHYEKFGRGFSLGRLYSSREQCRQDSAVLHVHPSRQPRHLFLGVDSVRHPAYRGNDRLHEKLSALGVAHRFEVAPRERLWPTLLSFLEAAILTESRRLL